MIILKKGNLNLINDENSAAYCGCDYDYFSDGGYCGCDN